MTVLVINREIIKSITILTVVIGLMRTLDVHKLRDCFRPGVKLTLAICYPLSTLSVLDLVRIRHLSQFLLPENNTYCLPEGNE